MRAGLAAAVFAASFLIFAAPSKACTPDGKEGIFPDNNLWIPDSRFGLFAVSEKEFDASVAKIEKVYTPILAAQGRTLRISSDWKDGTVNAYASRSGSTSELHLYGGLARESKMTPDGFTLVVCHEMGHHLGAAPKTRGPFGRHNWASNEGQADYFATLKCAREVWKDEDNETIMTARARKAEIPAVVTEKCQKAFDKTSDIALCQRSALAGKALGDTLADISRGKLPDFEQADPSVVNRTEDNHPAAQCRLDTYFAGAVCPKSKDEALSDRDPTVGTCAQERGDVLGIRPLCWYHPVEADGKPGSTWPSFQ